MSEPRTNWAKTLTFTPTRGPESARHPRTFQELSQRVRDATEAGRHVHAVGSFWSFTGAPSGHEVSLGPAHDEVTDPPGAPDELKLAEVARPGSYGGKLGVALLPAVKGAGRAFARIGCLVSVKEAIDALAAEGLGLVTMGSRTGQRVVGVISTGTHGGDFDLPPIADTVRAVHLVTHGGAELWIEPASARITTDSGVKLLDGASGVTVKADDGLFEAAIVSVGALGVIASIVLEVRPMYALSERSVWMKWDDVRARLADGTAFTSVAGLTDPAHPHPAGGAASAPLRSDGYRHLEVLVNPYPDRAGVHWAYVVTRVEHPIDAATKPDFERAESAISQVAIYIAVESGNPERYHDTLRELIGSTRTNTPGAHRYLSVQDTKGRKSQPAYSSELVVSTEGGAHLAAIDEMLAQIDRLSRDTPWEFSGFLSLRFTRASRGLLAMQSSTDASERFCHVEVFALQEIFWGTVKPQELEGKNEDYLDALFDVSERHEGRTHWGQWAHPDHPHSIRAFPRAQAFLEEKRAIAGDSPLGLFDNPFTVRAGLVPLDGWAFVGDGLVPTAATGAPFDTRALRQTAPGVVAVGARMFTAAASGDGVPALSRHDGSRSTSFEALGVEHGRRVDGRLVLAANQDGRLELFARFDDGRLAHAWARRTPDLRFTAFEAFDGEPRFGASPVVVRDRTGCLAMLAVDTQRRVLRRRQRSAGSTWKGWETTGSPFVSGALAAVVDPSGSIVVAARDTTGKLVLGAQVGLGQDDAFQWHTLSEACDAEPSLVFTPGGVAVTYFQGGVLRAFAVPAAALRTTSLPALTPLSSTTSSPPLVASQPASILRGSELVVAYPTRTGALALHRHALSGSGWASEQRIAAKLVSAVELVQLGQHVTAVGKLAHDLVIRRVVV